MNAFSQGRFHSSCGTGIESGNLEPSPVHSLSHRALINGVGGVLLLGVVFFLCVRIVSEPDCWFHMAFGRYVLEHGTLPPGDLFSHTGFGNEWISTGWASSVLLHGLHELVGPQGLVLLVFAVVAGAFGALYVASVRLFGNRGSVVLLLLPLALGTYLRFSPRPEIFSLLCITLEVLILVTADSSPAAAAGKLPRRLWLLAPLMAIWANLHGGFVIGFAPLGLYGLHRLWLWARPRTADNFRWLLPCAAASLA